ncbi:MAG: hypothetical protein ACPGTU_03635 [Myxococcota bacterium]
MITQTITALILSTGIDLGVLESKQTPETMAVMADTGAADDTGMTEPSDDTGDIETDTGSSEPETDDTGSGDGVNEDDGSNQGGESETVDTGSVSSGGKYSASELAGDKGGCSTVSNAPAHLSWLILGLLGWRRRT